MAIAIPDDRIGLPPPAAPARPRVLLVGTGIALSGIVMSFAALVGLYLERRATTIASGEPWFPKDVVTDLTAPNVALIGLVLSMVFVQWAVQAIGDEDRPRTYLALGLTTLMGLAYINSMAFNLTQMKFTVHDPTGVGLLVYAIVGMHIAMAAGGIVFVGLMAFRTLGGQYSGRDREGIVAAALYWHVTVAVYVVIWFMIFVTK
jgi:heme/copper-type cytochrome/quinol oxidase subunit 3